MAGSTLFLRRVAGRARRELAYLTIRRDLARWRRESRGLRSARPRAADEGVALIISLSDFVFSLKLEAMIATALRLAGYRVVVLTLPNARWARAYLGAAGVEEFVTPVEDIPADLVAEARAAAAAAHAANPGVQELKDFEYRGAYVGQQAISTLSRTFERGRISFDDKDVRAALAKLLPEAVQSTVAADLLLDRVRPGLVVFNEKGYAGYGSIYDLALRRGANVVQFVAAGIHTRDALLFKRYTLETRRIHPASLSRDSWEKARALPWTPQREAALEREFAVRYDSGEKHPDAGLQEGKELKGAEDVRRQLGLDPAKPTAIVFSHVLWDANLFYGDDLFADQETWLVETVKAACANPAANWVIKLHPANMYKARAGELNDETAIREAIGELPPHVKLLHPQTDINTYSLFAVADAAVTIRGTIGMEVPCFGVPVLTAGTGRYSGLGFTIDSATPEEYLDRLACIQELPRLDDAAVLLAKRHAYALFRLRAFVFSSYRASFASAARLAHPLSHNLRLTRRTQAQVEGAPDLRELGEWLADPSLLDYLASQMSSSCGAREARRAGASGAAAAGGPSTPAAPRP